MSVLAATNNGGRYNRVHRQTDDGIVISVVRGKDLVPLVFRWTDYLGDYQSSLLSASKYPHKRLMRGDCGVRRKDDSVLPVFSWNAIESKVVGVSRTPTGEMQDITMDVANCAKDVAICGVRGHRTRFYRKDRSYWTPDHTLLGDNFEEIFGFEQYNPQSCEPRKSNKCGLVTYKEEEEC